MQNSHPRSSSSSHHHLLQLMMPLIPPISSSNKPPDQKQVTHNIGQTHIHIYKKMSTHIHTPPHTNIHTSHACLHAMHSSVANLLRLEWASCMHACMYATVFSHIYAIISNTLGLPLLYLVVIIMIGFQFIQPSRSNLTLTYLPCYIRTHSKMSFFYLLFFSFPFLCLAQAVS